MNREDWQKVKNLFGATLELSPAKRQKFLDNACGNDSAVRREVELLLAKAEDAEDFLENRAVDKITEIVVKQKSLVNESIGHYKIVSLIGAGGMGEVYLAEDTELKRKVALKFLSGERCANAEHLRRFQQEAQLASALNHPNILTVYQIGRANDQNFIASEFVAGETLRDKLHRQARLGASETLEIAVQIASALQSAHAAGIVHRDIKPENVMIRDDGLVKVLDFGLAKLTETEPLDLKADTRLQVNTRAGVILGTVAYMSPEQARGFAVDARTDVWSLGIVIYEMLTGVQPFRGETTSDVIAAILKSEIEAPTKLNPQIPAELERILLKMLGKEREERYANATNLLANLQALKKRLEFEAELNQVTSINSQSDKETVVIESEPEKTDSLASGINSNRNQLINPTEGSKFLQTRNQADDNVSTRELKSSEIPVNLRRSAWKNLRWILAGTGVALVVFLLVSLVWKFSRSNVSPLITASRSDLKFTVLLNVPMISGSEIQHLSFSPNGNFLAFHQTGEGKSSVYIKQIDGGEAIKVTDGKWLDRSPVWSPDGQRLAFLSNRDNQTAIWTVPFLGGSPPELLKKLDFPESEFIELKKWSNDRRTIYLKGIKLYALDLTTGQVSQIAARAASDTEIYNVSISPDEEKVAYNQIVNGKNGIFVQSLKGNGEPKQIAPGEGAQLKPSWFPDGKHLIYSSNQSGRYNIYAANIDDGKSIQLTSGDTDSLQQIVSPDDRRVIYLTTKDDANVYSFNLDNNQETARTANFGLQLLPDVARNGGNRLVFQSSDAKINFMKAAIILKSLEGTGAEAVLTNNGFDAKFSPDGESIAFLRSIEGKRNLWRASVNGKSENQLTTGDVLTSNFIVSPISFQNVNYDWSPDGNQIAYSSKKSGHCNLWTILKDGSSEAMWTQNADKNLIINSPIWSPDGNRIAHLAQTTSQSAAEKEENRICISRQNQTEIVYKSTSTLRLLGWSADGANVFAVSQQRGTPETSAEISVIKISTENNRSETIARFPAANFYNFKLSPDGKQIVYSGQTEAKAENLFLLEISSGGVRRLTNNQESALYYTNIAWSPEAKTLYYSKQKGYSLISMIFTTK